MEIVHHSRFRGEMAAGRRHSRYFRLIHHLRPVPQPGAAPSGVEFAPISADRAGEMAGSVIGKLDPEAWKAVIEWLPVLPGYRRRGIAAALVLRALDAMTPFADFATVFGECDNPTRPEAVCRACGFTWEDVWHILR